MVDAADDVGSSIRTASARCLALQSSYTYVYIYILFTLCPSPLASYVRSSLDGVVSLVQVLAPSEASKRPLLTNQNSLAFGRPLGCAKSECSEKITVTSRNNWAGSKWAYFSGAMGIRAIFSANCVVKEQRTIV